MDKIFRIKELTSTLNNARNEYYNNSNSIMADVEYDKLFDELSSLEKETGIILNNSPTQTVGFEVKSKLEKVPHNHPMLSLDKTKSIEDIVDFLGDKDGIAMLKMDGLTCSTRYNEYLVSAETRGNGEVGENILSNARTITNLPLHISLTENLIVDGEVIIDYDTFNKINEKLPIDEKYKTPRNLASGSIRQLDSNIASKRDMKFIAWKAIDGIESNYHSERLNILENSGFSVVPFMKIYNIKNKQLMKEKIEAAILELKKIAEELHYPIDGIVFGYDDIKYGESLGLTGHHVKSQMAYKFYDEEVETTLLEIEWSPSRTGLLNPVAIFDTVEIDGTTVSRASLHNLSIIEDLKLGIGDVITVYKANQIIPQVKDNLTKSDKLFIPMICPICGEPTHIKKDNDSKVLYCTNPNCKSKLLGKLDHFCDKNSMNIEGISESTLEKFVDLDWLTCLSDIYKLSEHKIEIVNMDGFGIKSYNNMIESIEKSKNVKVENFIRALGINNIGRSQSKELTKKFNNNWYEFEQAIQDVYDFTQIDGFGDVLDSSIHSWYKKFANSKDTNLANIMNFTKNQDSNISHNKSLDGKSFCITGSLIKYPNRDTLVKDIEMHGGKVVSGVTKKTDMLLTNDVSSGSSKNQKAKELNIPIVTEEQFIEMINKEVY